MGKLLKVGDKVELKAGCRVMTLVPRHLVNKERLGDFKLYDAIVSVEGEFAYLAGTYLVSEGRGVDGGHRVTCLSVCGMRTVRFFQTGTVEPVQENILALPKDSALALRQQSSANGALFSADWRESEVH